MTKIYLKSYGINLYTRINPQQKRLIFHFKPQTILITSPRKLSQQQINEFLKKYEKEIKENCIKEIKPPQFVLHLWGQKYNLDIKIDTRNDYLILENTIIIKVTREENIKKVIKNLYNNELASIAEKYFRLVKSNIEIRLDQKLNITFKGVAYYKSFLGRYFTRTKEIQLSGFLAKYPKDYINVVLTHEICHYFYPNHSLDFKKLLKSLIPDIANYSNWQKKYNSVICGDYL